MDQITKILDRLLALHPKEIDLSLGRMYRLLEALGHPEQRLPPVIHVAGTNGKGSVTATMRAILEASGKRCHVYTSPHLVSFNERIRLGSDGQFVSDPVLYEALHRCEEANGGEEITFSRSPLLLPCSCSRKIPQMCCCLKSVSEAVLTRPT